MMEVDIIKAIEMVLHERISDVDFKECDEYRVKESEIVRLEDILRKALPECIETPAGTLKASKVLLDFIDANGNLAGITAEIAYKKGFREGIKALVACLIGDS